MRTSARLAAARVSDSAHDEADAGKSDGGVDKPLKPDVEGSRGAAASLLRRGSLNASAALAVLRDPLSHTWLGAPAASQPPPPSPQLVPDAPRPREAERLRALDALHLPTEVEDDSDDDLQAASEPSASARHAAVARLLDEQESAETLGEALGSSPRSSGATGGVRLDATLDAELLAHEHAGVDASVDDHPLAHADAGLADEEPLAADGSGSTPPALHIGEPDDTYGAADDSLPSAMASDADAASAESAAALSTLEHTAAWAAPPAAAADAAANTAAMCRQALRDAAGAHFRHVLSQVLHGAGVPHADEWVPILADLAAAAAAAVSPAAGGAAYSMDPRDYVCVKRCATGRRADSRLVCGVVCRRNVAHRRMATHVESPRLLLLAGALQYQRVEGRLSSLDTLLEQERAHLRVACARAAALRPNVLLVEKSCARYAQELLLGHGIALVLNVKPAVLRRLARATGAAVAPGADQLREVHLATCGAFRVEAITEELAPAPPPGAAPAAQRTLMVFDGCPLPLCATVLLAGAPPDELARVKAFTPWAVYAAHHLRLEAAFLADELAAAGTEASAAAAAVSAAVAAAAASLRLPPLPSALCISLSPHTSLMPHGQAPPTNERAAAAWAAATVRAEERLLVSLSCRCTTRRALCEPHNVRAIDHYCGTDVPLGHFLAAALPGPGRRCGCGAGPEAHVRSYAAGAGQLTLHVRPTAVAAPGSAPARASPGGQRLASDEADASSAWDADRAVWHWSSCAACAASSTTAAPRARILLSEASLQLSLGKFLALSLTALKLQAPCGHSLHAQALRFFGTHAGTACIAYAPMARFAVTLPPPTLLPVRRCAIAWVTAELSEVSVAAAAEWTELRVALRASWADHKKAYSAAVAKEPPVLLSELEAALEADAKAFATRVSDVDAQRAAGRPDIFAVNRLRRTMAAAHRKWSAVLAELASSAWRSSFPVDARRGWGDAAPYDSAAGAGAQPVAALVAQAVVALPAAAPSGPAGATATASIHSRTPSDRAAPLLLGRALLPLGVGGAAIVVFDEEPTSVVAYALASQQYGAAHVASRAAAAAVAAVAAAPVDARASAALAAAGVRWEVVASPAVTHVRCSFEDRDLQGGPGGARFSVTAFYAPQFEALRALWGMPTGSVLRSLCRCARWDSTGGKSGAYFAKTCDDRFVVKGLSRPELGSLLEFAPVYAAYAAAAAADGRAVLLAKLVGVFSVHVIAAGRRDIKLDCVVMENVFAGGGHGPVFDLKGAVGRSRAAPDDAPVLLDENLLERIAAADAPLCVAPAAADAIAAAVWRDTAFLARVGVMDYSLLVGVQAHTHPRRLACGIVDYLRQYTWDKQLETYVKSSSAVLALGGSSSAAQPTVISPKQYARRFRKAMRSYFVVVPDVYPPVAADAADAAPRAPPTARAAQPTDDRSIQ